MHDLVIENARIIDGTGAPAYLGSIAVDGGVITAIGTSMGATRERVNAEGLTLTPGIIDNHTHYDAQITWDPWVSPSPALGVTSVIMGNCGFTVAPCRPADRGNIVRNLTHVEGMSLAALETGMQWQFESFPEYLGFLERRGVGVNVAVFVGHSSVRTWAMGADAPNRAATDAEIDTMRQLVREALAAGAVGFSTTTSSQHNGEGGRPMPSRLATFRETELLASELSTVGRGVLMMTKDPKQRVADVEGWAVAAGRPFVVAALFHSNVTPDAVFDDLTAMHEAKTRHCDIRGAVSPCPLTMEFTLKAPYVFEGLTAWRPAMEARDDASYRALLASPAFREALHQELSVPKPRLFDGRWNLVTILKTRDAKNAHLEGKSVAEAAAAAGKRPFDFLLDLGLEENLETYFIAALLNTDDAALGRMLNDSRSVISLSDAGAHLEFFCDAGFALHVLGHWVRDRGLMTIERAIHRMTGEQAELFGLRGRGRIAPGFAADLFLFDADTVGRGPSRRVNDLPAGASRLVSPAIGVQGVWVNGERVADASGPRPGAALKGKVLREFDA